MHTLVIQTRLYEYCVGSTTSIVFVLFVISRRDFSSSFEFDGHLIASKFFWNGLEKQSVHAENVFVEDAPRS